MTGINTLIDTLLHGVLGKRVDIPQPKPLNEPVRPLTPAEAALAVRSDSRLEAGRVPVKDMPMPAPAKGGAAPRGGSAPQSSIQASFSPAGRAIAEVLARFPSPPSVLTHPVPLVAAGETPAPTDLAVRLKSSISESGLFYEQHLNRWYRGEMTLQQLAREPQMQWQQSLQSGGGGAASQGVRLDSGGFLPTDRAGPSTAVGQGASASPQAAQGAASQVAGQPVVQGGQSASPLSAPVADAASLKTGVEESVRSLEQGDQSRATPVRPDLPENLQGIVRHQLELLSFPVLRWEGDIWSGLFLALMIQLPEQNSHRDHGGEREDGSDRDQDRAWRSELQLKVAGLGNVKVNIYLLDDKLDLRLSVYSQSLLQKLEAGSRDLVERLRGCGFAEPMIRLSLLDPPDQPEGNGDDAHG